MLKVKRKLSRGKCPRCGNLFETSGSELEVNQIDQATDIFSKASFDTSIDIPCTEPDSRHQSPKNAEPISLKARRKKTRQLVLKSIFKKVQRGFPKESVGINYRFKVAIVGLAMLMIPILYVGTFSAIGYSLFQYAGNQFRTSVSMFSWNTLFYSGTVTYGIMIMVFFIKPFMGCLNRPIRKRRLEREKYAELYQFVDHLCNMIHAPKPKVIVIDLEGNASASYRTNRFCVKDELVLTIGLPLVANLTITQFAGILAHEFGHFTQRWGMWLTQTIRLIHKWLKQSVNEPDIIDDFITTSLHSGNVFLIIIGALLWVPVKIVHIFLRVLLVISNVFSSFLLREMEFEADRYQGRLVGIDQMADTMRCVLETNYALLIARNDILTNSSSKNITENFPEYVAEIRKYLPDEIMDAISIHMDESQTAFLGTHPSLSDRIHAQKAHQWPGMLNSNISAKFLFRNFDSLSTSQTKKIFKHLIR
jgi:Zn-dependent protease with chaperone function